MRKIMLHCKYRTKKCFYKYVWWMRLTTYSLHSHSALLTTILILMTASTAYDVFCEAFNCKYSPNIGMVRFLQTFLDFWAHHIFYARNDARSQGFYVLASAEKTCIKIARIRKNQKMTELMGTCKFRDCMGKMYCKWTRWTLVVGIGARPELPTFSGLGTRNWKFGHFRKIH